MRTVNTAALVDDKINEMVGEKTFNIFTIDCERFSLRQSFDKKSFLWLL